MTHNSASRRGFIGRISFVCATLVMLSACAATQDQTSWSTSGLATGKVGVMGPSGPIGP